MSKISQTALEAYLKGVFRLILVFFPGTAALAAVTFTVLRALGSYADVSWGWLIAFDVVCFSYALSTLFGFWRNGFAQNQSMTKVRRRAEILLAIILPLQFNLISYLFPAADLWAFSVFFVMLSAFLLSNRFVLVVTAEMVASLLLSWLIQPRLLPVHDAYFTTNLALRFVLLCIALLSIWSLTYLVEKTLLAGVSAQSKEDEVNRVKEEVTTIFKESFLGMYVSAYYVNLNDCSQYVFSRADYVEEKYGKIDNYLVSITRYILECVHPDDREKMIEAVQPSYIRERLQTEDGFSTYMRDISGGVQKWYRFVVTKGVDSDHAGLAFTDITKKVEEDERRERELQQALALAKHTSQSKTDFLNNLSHEIRTPMNAIVNFTDLAASRIDDKEQAKDYLSKIRRSSDHLLSLINDVLDISRIESGKMTLCESDEDLGEILIGLRDLVRPGLEKKHQAFIADSVGIRDRLVVCDRLRLNQALLNILSNAIKYTPEGGSVSFFARQKDCSRLGCAAYEFVVEDTGVGMSPEFVQTIFEPFARDESALHSRIQGTGLGMAITKSIVDMMGGDIAVSSEPGKGTRITVSLVFKLSDNLSLFSEEASSALETDFSGRRILLVEDNDLNLEIAQVLLESCGFEIETARDGAEAVQKVSQAAEGDIDLILMDVQMPVMNGYEATRRIRALDGPLAHIPIIAMTANAFSEDRRASLDAGMDEHLAKPINVDALKQVLSRFLR